MFEKEEKELDRLNNYFKELSIPNDFGNEAILKGIKKANKIKNRNRHIHKVFLSASILFLSLLTSVKVSETMAAYISNVPGMDKVVELVRNDKGLLTAVENDYIQKVVAADSHDGINVSIESVIHDERSLIIFYRYNAENPNLDFFPKEILLKDISGKVLPTQVEKGIIWSKNKDGILEVRFPLSPNMQLPDDLMLSFTFRLGSGELLENEWNLPFTLDKDKFAEKKVVNLNQKMIVEDQEITIKKITSYPSVTAVHVTYNPENSKKIFGFNDLQLVDENGEVWGFNGLKATELSEDESIFYLESNYFKKPKKLYLTFKTIRALDKDELWVVIDPENNEVLKSPMDGKISKVEKGMDQLYISLNVKPYSFKEEIFNITEEVSGQNIIGSMGVGPSPSGNNILYTIPYSPSQVQGPIKLKLIDYPLTIQSEKEVRIKIK